MPAAHDRFLERLGELQGGMSDAAFARLIGVPPSTFQRYRLGSFPSIEIAAKIADACNVSVDWLSGREQARKEMISRAPTIDPDLMEKLARLVSSVYRDAGQRLPGERATLEAATLYNELAGRVGDLADAEEIEAALPHLRFQLKKRLSEAAAEPGTGKREAS